MRTLIIPILLAVLSVAAAHAAEAVTNDSGSPAAGVRLKDLCDIYGVRDNQLHGIGIVVGLTGTGDKSTATLRILRQMLATKRFSVSETDLASKNVAMVAVTADLPAF